jgi:hypothetical protein
MPTVTIDHSTFMKLTEADVVRHVQVIGQPIGWAIVSITASTQILIALTLAIEEPYENSNP